MPNTSSFLGTGWAFPPHFVKEGLNAPEMVSDEEDINQSLEILLNTFLGERMMQPKFGTDLHRLIFEPMNATLETYVTDLIQKAILFYEPRIVLDRVDIETDDVEGQLLISVNYSVPGTNTRYNFVYPFFIDEAIQNS